MFENIIVLLILLTASKLVKELRKLLKLFI
jgi:hypothetical protein